VIVEDTLPDSFKRVAFHPAAPFYAWKKGTLEKLFDELTKSNIAVIKVETVVVEGKISHTVQLKTGQIELFELENKPEKAEDWYDFVERINKETLEIINGWDLEKSARPDLRNKIWYHFEMEQK